MPLTEADMRSYLSRSLSSINTNKLNGLLAEVAFRNELARLGFAGNVSPGGWIARSTKFGNYEFGHTTVALFPETVQPNTNYPSPPTSTVPRTHYLVASHFHTISVQPIYCRPQLTGTDPVTDLTWIGEDLSPTNAAPSAPLQQILQGFKERSRRYNFLRYHSDTSQIPLAALADEFSKEHLRVSLQNEFMSEISDMDAIFWGRSVAYPIEIKEKTPAPDDKLGPWFGLDIGPFTKLAFFASHNRNMASLFIVHEIDDATQRNHVCWLAITFDKLAKAASWFKMEGGQNMQGGGSAVVRIPKSAFSIMDKNYLDSL